MNAIMERWVGTCRREYETFYNTHRPHQGIAGARPLAALPEPITYPDRLAHLKAHR